jgi:hypothetical protein
MKLSCRFKERSQMGQKYHMDLMPRHRSHLLTGDAWRLVRGTHVSV